MELPRTLGRVGRRRGRDPLVVVVGGLHGNEPAGVRAAERVLEKLHARSVSLGGEVVFLAGNRTALARGVRFVDRDLNRAWSREAVEARRRGAGEAETAEDREQAELLEVIDELLRSASGAVYVLDLHTTSGAGGAFSTTADTLENRALALELPVPLVLGLEELVEGTLHDYLDSRGCITLAFEAGQHDEEDAVTRAEGAIWLTLAATGLIREAEEPTIARARKELAREGRRHPRVVEMRYRHPIAPDDGYRMEPGFRNFQPVHKGQVLGQDRAGTVRAPERGRMLMPLYQAQGEDGYFIVREFRPFWLHLSRLVRQIGLGRWVHWLPGIHMNPARPEVLVVNRRVARWYALQILHLLGYRRQRLVGDKLVVLRRPHARGAPGEAS